MKTGQHVILMDSNDRGVILSIGKHSVKIELEDGLVIEAVPGEFALTNEDEEKQMKSFVSVSDKTTYASGRRKKTSTERILTVDLHIESLAGGSQIPEGRRLDYQMEIFRRIMRENLKHKGMKIVFIHGIGDGILKNAVRRDLDEIFAVSCSYEIGNPAVTTVTVK